MEPIRVNASILATHLYRPNIVSFALSCVSFCHRTQTSNEPVFWWFHVMLTFKTVFPFTYLNSWSPEKSCKKLAICCYEDCTWAPLETYWKGRPTETSAKGEKITVPNRQICMPFRAGSHCRVDMKLLRLSAPPSEWCNGKRVSSNLRIPAFSPR